MQLGEGAAQLTGQPPAHRGRVEHALALVPAEPCGGVDALDHAPHLEPAVGRDMLDRGDREAADPPVEEVQHRPLAPQALHRLGIVGEEGDAALGQPREPAPTPELGPRRRAVREVARPRQGTADGGFTVPLAAHAPAARLPVSACPWGTDHGAAPFDAAVPAPAKRGPCRKPRPAADGSSSGTTEPPASAAHVPT